MNRPRWTPEAEAHLSAHYGRERAADIAVQLGMTVAQVKNKARRMGLRSTLHLRHDAIRVDRDAVASLYLTHTTAEIAGMIGCHVQTVRRIAHDAGLVPSSGQPMTRQYADALLSKYMRMTARQIAEQEGVSKSCIEARIRMALRLV